MTSTAREAFRLLTDVPATLARAEGDEQEGYWRLLGIFNGYRVVVALVLLVGIELLGRTSFVPNVNVTDFEHAALAYLLLVIGGILLQALRRPGFEWQLSGQVAVDVVAFNVLSYLAGGIRSGLLLILFVTIAASGLLSRGRLAAFHAALAAIGVLLAQAWGVMALDRPVEQFLQAGLLSFGFFGVATLAWAMARYASGAVRLAIQRGIDLANLSEINRLVIGDMQDGVLVVDRAGRIRAANPRAESFLGSIPGESPPRLAEFAPGVASRVERWRVEPGARLDPVSAGNSGRELHVRCVAIGDGARRATVVFLTDFSEQQKQVQQVKLAALGRLTASIAHEIRNPLSSIHHAAELMQEDDSLGPDNARLAGIIRDNARRLERLVQEVLSLNRRDQARLAAIPGREYLEAFAAEFCDLEKVPAEIFSLEIDTDRPLLFDRIHLHQVLWNLTRNALRHCRKQADSIRLCLAPAALDGMLQLDIVDDGPGVDSELQGQLFEPFFTTDAQGTGLGLYIARQVCQANGAQLEYVSVAPGGQFRMLMKAAEA